MNLHENFISNRLLEYGFGCFNRDVVISFIIFLKIQINCLTKCESIYKKIFQFLFTCFKIAEFWILQAL